MSRAESVRVLAAVAMFAAVAALAACGSTGRDATGSNSIGRERTGASSTQPPTTRPSGPARATSSPPRSTAKPATGAEGVPGFRHIVVVIEENKPYGELVGTPDTPFLTGLAGHGAVLTQSYAISHPSEPNYLALFSGSTQGLHSDSCPHQFSGPNLAASLISGGHTFVGYSESLPATGATDCSSGGYARKHAPWVNFALPSETSQPMTAFPSDGNQLPDVAFVIPNLDHDMHDGSIAEGDQWLSAHLAAYRDWAASHDSLLIVTTDEDDRSHDNHITTIVAGAHVKAGQYPQRVDHYGLLRTLLDSFALAPFAGAANATPITGIWSGRAP